MLGLADQVGGDVHRVGGVVGQDGDLGRAGLGVDADHAAQQPLGRGDLDVARAGDHVDRLATSLVAGRRSRRRPASRSPGRRRPRRPRRRRAARRRRAPGASGRPPLSFCGGLATTSERDPGHLGRHDVHHHAGRIHRPGRRARRGRPGRPAPSARSPCRRAPPGWCRRCGAGRRAPAGPASIDSVSAARTCGSRLRSAAAIASAGTRSGRGPTPSNRWVASRIAGKPCSRTASTSGRICSTATRDVELGTGQQAARVCASRHAGRSESAPWRV